MASEQVDIRVRFSAKTQYGEYNDAIYYASQAEFDLAKSNGSHEAQKASRVSNYITVIQTPQPAPTKQQLIDAKASLQAQLISQIADIDSQIASAK